MRKQTSQKSFSHAKLNSIIEKSGERNVKENMASPSNKESIAALNIIFC